ncbi:hypothetical protein [Helicobacter canis]|uniref:hypothetical protein n=1 Tax=Helicobacter canis TaxID=29419 RepID=UPI000E0FB468|nr:hypothetical protein [Helicobacter canis]
MQKFEYSILPYMWISAALTLLLIYFARKSRTEALKLTLSYLTILPLCIIAGRRLFLLQKACYKQLSAYTAARDFGLLPIRPISLYKLLFQSMASLSMIPLTRTILMAIA